MTADNVIGIFTSRAMKERGRYQIQFMKTRSSSGVGQKVDLEFNVETLRISDLEEEEEGSLAQKKSPNNVVSGLKRTSVVSTASTNEPLDVSKAPWATRENPNDGYDISKSKPKTTSGPAIRSMLNNLHPEKD